MSEKQINLIQNLFVDIKKIIDEIEFKDNSEASKYETSDTKSEAQMWIDAYLELDTYLTYKKYWKLYMFQEVLPNVKINNVKYWMENPLNVPIDFRDTLLKEGRKLFLEQYEEKNDYYRMLSGNPPYNTTSSDFIYLSDSTYEKINAEKGIPIHELSYIEQNLLLLEDEYTEILANNLDKKYLKYLGKNKIDLFIARKAKDFEIIKYPDNRYDINSNLLREFKNLYNEYREYVISTLYNDKLESLYGNYRTYMGLIILSSTIMQISNKSLESMLNKNFLDDSVIHTILSMYGIKKGSIFSNKIRRNLVINLFKLIQNKGTNVIYSDLNKILEYSDIVVSKLMLMKNQKFDNGKVLFSNGEEISSFDDLNKIKFPEYSNNTIINTYTPDSDLSFVKINIDDENPYDTITKGNAKTYSYHEIVDDDPTWWDLPDNQHLLKYANYTIADTKYIIVESIISQMQYIFESIYFPKIILDNKYSTETFDINIPDLFGDEDVSLYDLMIFIIAATCIINDLKGNSSFGLQDKVPLNAISGFNFDINYKFLIEYLNTTKYVDKDKIITWIDNIKITTIIDINRVYNDIIYPMSEYLKYNLAESNYKEEYLEYENIYKALYTYDIANTYITDFDIPIELIRKKYNLSKNDINEYMHFYPRTISGEAITDEEIINQIRYTLPFLSNEIKVTWYVPIIINDPNFGIINRGNIYFHDILNSKDIKTITNSDGDRILVDWEDDNGWKINKLAVDELIKQINNISLSELNKAFFQTRTPNKLYDHSDKDSIEFFEKNKLLPDSIRNYIFKNILLDKINMDLEGLSDSPKSYLEYLSRRNKTLYNLLISNDRFIYNKEVWLENIRTIINTIETVLDINTKYFEQSIIGNELFFKPLITLINRFKSTYIHLIKTGIIYIFADKIDIGGNSQLLKLFDLITLSIHYAILGDNGNTVELMLYDLEYSARHHIELNDKSQYIRQDLYEYKVSNRKSWMGSLYITDEVKFFKNGTEIDPLDHSSSWYSGEHNIGRYENDEEIIMQSRYKKEKIDIPIDYEGWKDFVEK